MDKIKDFCNYSKLATCLSVHQKVFDLNLVFELQHNFDFKMSGNLLFLKIIIQQKEIEKLIKGVVSPFSKSIFFHE